MAKKKEKENKSQKSLFSFVDNSKEKRKESIPREEQKKPKKSEKKKSKRKIEKSQEPKIPPGKLFEKASEIEKKSKTIEEEKQEIKKIPNNYFFKQKDKPFGIQAARVELEKIKRENVSSRYIRYLIKKEKIVKNMEKGLLLDVDYDGGQNKAVCKFYDLETEEIKIWLDTTNHEPYCLSKKSIAELENNIELTNYEGFKRFETVKRMDLLRDKEIKMTKIYGNSPTDIGGSRTNIRKILGSGNAWEANIRYHLNYIYDRELIPGLIYTIKDGDIERITYEENEGISENLKGELTNIFKNEPKEMREFAASNLDIFLTPIPKVKRLALDIEVQMGPNQNAIPNPRQAKQPVISVSFVANDGLQKVFMLEREGFSFGELHEKFPSEAELIFFKKEKKLIEETFRLIWKYPVLVTFNGDNFDLNYLSHRATKLRIKRDLNPIHVKRGYGFLSRAECNLRHGIHIDLFNFFFNRSISGYAFGGTYERSSLNSISSALLGKEKYPHEEEIHELNYGTLAWYNLKDSILTMELTQFNNSLVWNLIILLCRMTKMPIHDMLRHQISSWIQNIFFFEHRQQKYLIPLRREISEMKKGGYSKSTIEGKGFKGAYVIEPEPGIYFDVVVMDFASLYPSIIKEFNLSYETVQCPHEDCLDNMIKGIPYHVCTHKMGVFAYVVGFLRDIRVKYFKPKSKDDSLSQKHRDYDYTIQQAIKVFINGCLPSDEEVIIRRTDNVISKIKIGDLENHWKGKEILSIDRNSRNFGSKKFVKIKGITTRNAEEYLEITLSDGRRIRCTSNHIIPKIENLEEINEINAANLKIGDQILVFHKNQLNSNPSNEIFIPNIIPTHNLWISLGRKQYKKYSYRTSESTNNPIINLIHTKFHYSKVSKIYKCLWAELDITERRLIEKESQNHNLHFYVKYGEKAGRWVKSFLNLPIEFFELLGWYIAEGSIEKNRITITQNKKLRPKRYKKIISLIKTLEYPHSHDRNKTIRINSNILKQIFVKLCSKVADNKKIPLKLLDSDRGKALIDNYYLGDGNLKKGKWRRFTTKSKQLKNDLVFLIGALGGYCSVVNPKKSSGVYRIIETEGRKYRRKNHGLVNFNGTTPVRIKKIKIKKKEQKVLDIETGNGWFVTTNGIIVHNSYGVFGSKNFPLFCLPVAESTTGIGRYSIKSTVEKAEEMDVKVLYGDSDSVFLHNPSKKQLEELSQWSKKELDLDLEEEKTYQFLGLSDRKKNYIGIYKDTQYVDMKGLLAKKKNTPDFIKKVFQDLIEILKEIRNMDEFEQAKNIIIETVRKSQKKIGRENAFPLEDYTINISLRKKLDSYNKTTPQHVRAALDLKSRTGKELQKGDVVSFIKSKDSAGAKAISLAKIQDLDIKKYKELLRSALEQVLDALGITYEEIKGIKKMDAFF